MSLSQTQVSAFHENGYLVVENVLDEGDLKPVIDEYSELIENRAKGLLAEGKIQSPHERESFTRRLLCLASEVPEIATQLDIMQVRGKNTFQFLLHPKILDIAESFVGGEIICNPTQHIRAVMPLEKGIGQKTTPWHQDAGVLWPECDPYFILTVWIPIVDATLENGCLEVMPGSHKLGLRRHEMTPSGLHVVDEDVPPLEPLPLPAPAGSVVLFHNYTLHRGRPNQSDSVRWSFDLRYHDSAIPTGRPHQPGFIVRSRLRPETVQDDYDMWRSRWEFSLWASQGVKNYRWS